MPSKDISSSSGQVFDLFDPTTFQGCEVDDWLNNTDLGFTTANSLDTSGSLAHSNTLEWLEKYMPDLAPSFGGISIPSLNPGLFDPYDNGTHPPNEPTPHDLVPTISKHTPCLESFSISNLFSGSYAELVCNPHAPQDNNSANSAAILDNAATTSESTVEETPEDTIRRLKEEVMQKELLIQQLQGQSSNHTNFTPNALAPTSDLSSGLGFNLWTV